MRRRLLDLSLLAYPRTRRRRDRLYLRDLALELAQQQGLARQALSLLFAGVRERAAHRARWSKAIGVASALVAALALGASTLGVSIGNNRDVDRFACAASIAAGEHAVQAQSSRDWECTRSF